ncbi:c-type cytochrome [Planctomycetota bacterium]|nr:c-type cytochrome [Planctomycetota bacterium]
MQNGLTLLFAFVACTVAAAFGYWVGPSGQDTTDTPDTLTPLTQKYDKTLANAYVDEQCWQCHSVSTLSAELERDFGAFASGARPSGPDLAGIGTLYTREWHVAHFKNPQSLAPGSLMPAQNQLFEDTGKLNNRGKAVIAFLKSLNEPSRIRTVWPTQPQRTNLQPNSRSGALVFQKFCAGCHGSRADGQGTAAKWLVQTPPANLRAGQIVRKYSKGELGLDDVYTTITNGIKMRNMPSFNGTLSKQERTDVAAYVMKLYTEAK